MSPRQSELVETRAPSPGARVRPLVDSGQDFFCRYFSWQPPQLSLSKGPQVDLKVSTSFTAPCAALESLPNFSNRALKSALFSQIAGSAAVSPPVLELSGNSGAPDRTG